MRKIIGITTIMLIIIAIPAICFAWGSNPLILTYAGGTGKGSSISDFSENNWQYQYQYHVFVLSGDIPQGTLVSQFQIEQRDADSGLTLAKIDLYGKTYEVDFGDNNVNFSDLTLNTLNYQGAGITLRPTNNMSFMLVGGSRGYGLWGAAVKRDTRAREDFTGFKSSYSPIDGLGLTAIYLTTPAGNNVLSLGGEYSGNDLKIGIEEGSATEGNAVKGEIRYQNNWLTIGTIYRDIGPTYNVPFDYINYRGKKGTYSNLGLRPANNLSINVQSDSYIDSLNTSSESYNLDTRGDIIYTMPSSGTNIGYSGWKNDRTSYDRGGITEGEMMYITQQFYLLTRNAIYYRFQPTWYDSNNASEESYNENKNITGINISLFDVMHLNYETEYSLKCIKSTDVVLNPTAVSMRMDMFESQIADTPFYVTTSVNYRLDKPNPDADASEESTTTYADVTLKYIPGPDLNCYFTAKSFIATAPDEARSARQETDLAFGLSYSFNTYIYLK